MIARATIPIAALAALCAALALGLAAELAARPTVPDGAVAPAALPALRPLPVVAPSSVEALAARPLFTPTRRPAPPEAKEEARPEAAPAPPLPPPPPPPATELTLIGVIESAGARLAVIRVQGQPAPVRVTEGGKVDRWTVARIEPDQVVLRADGAEQPLRFPPPRQGQPGRPRPRP